jgi:hypothetical protein
MDDVVSFVHDVVSFVQGLHDFTGFFICGLIVVFLIHVFKSTRWGSIIFHCFKWIAYGGLFVAFLLNAYVEKARREQIIHWS